MDAELESKRLKAIIIDRIRRKGTITFAEYMDMALYTPTLGYYNSAREKIGKDGDYYTSPHVHPVFGRLIARLIYRMWEILEKGQDFSIVEAGAGKGFLCFDILNYTRQWYPDFYQSLTYNIIEISDHFSSFQRELLEKHSHEGKVTWYSPVDFKRGKLRFNGCYLSNEFLDSFPFNIVKMEGGELREVYVTLKEGAFVEKLGDLSTPTLKQYFKDLNVELQEGQKAEVNLRIFDWLKEVQSAMGRGFLTSIDYGYMADELFAPHRENGTLCCYYKHTINHNPYIRVGLQDITAHVDFTTVIETGKMIGLKKTCYMEQYRFLLALGLLDIIDDLENKRSEIPPIQYLREKLSMKNFLMPGGMGVLFKVLIQHKGVKDPQISDLFTKGRG